ncbi:MAG: HAD hydrolase family protein, partial [Myxococcota bacterium]|nr:HAD hydrolase family protein [Myxococcota bacterium]
MTPKLLAVDLDGTLLDVRGQPHARDLRALRAVIAAGVRVSIITGRLYSGTRPMAELLGLRWPVGCVDGSHLVDARLHVTLMHLGVRGSEAGLLREALGRARLTTFVFAQDAIGYDLTGAPFVEYVRTWSKDLRLWPDVFEHPLWACGEGVTAVVALGTPERIDRAVSEIESGLSSAAVVARFPIRREAYAGLWAIII